MFSFFKPYNDIIFMRLCTLHTTTISAHVAEKFKEVGSDLTRHKDTKEAALIKVWTAVESNYYF